MDLGWAGRGDGKTATGTCVPRAHRGLAFTQLHVCGGEGEGRNAVGLFSGTPGPRPCKEA